MQRILEAIGADTPLGVVILDHGGSVRHVNERMLAWTGRKQEDCLNKPLLSLLPEAAQTGCACLHSARNGCGPFSQTTPMQEEGAANQLIKVNIGDRHLTCLLCLPFGNDKGQHCYALLFDDADEATGFRMGLALTVKRLQEIQLDQHRLLAKLEHANSHLLRAEKMAGIGQLAAGVAHEINNPIGYVFSNLKTLAGYMHDMLKIIDAADAVSTIDELRSLKRALDYDYIRGDVEALIDESEEGIDRVKKIITALKDFSHTEEEGFRKASLHRAIDTTLNVVNNELKYKAQIVKCYGALPLVECNLSQVNQVILNLLMNAAQALSEFGTITIRTGQAGQWAWMEVEDTGKGMDASVKDRIFEPFFTTKPLGQGTGLGLSLSYSIVQKHHGRIDVTSEPGTGSRFRVWLPVSHDALEQGVTETPYV